MKDKLSKFIANILPTRVMLWAIIRLYAYASTYDFHSLHVDSIGFNRLYKSWENKLNHDAKH